MNAKHTQGKWEVVDHDGCTDSDSAKRFIDTNTAFIETENEQTARHIVRCVNSHDDLLAALKALIAESPNQTPAGDAARAAMNAATEEKA